MLRTHLEHFGTTTDGRLFRGSRGGLRLLWGNAVAWLIVGGQPRLLSLEEKRLGTFGSLPVSLGSSSVQCCLPLVLERIAGPCRRCSLVHAGGLLVRLGSVAERLRAGGQHSHGGGVRLGRMALGRFQPLGDGGLAVNGGEVSFSEFFKPRTDHLKPGTDLFPATWRTPGLVVHASQHA